MKKISLWSPDASLCLEIAVIDGALSYSVVKNSVTVIESSPIGARLTGVDLTCGLTVVSEKRGEINDQYTIPAFKKSLCLDHCNTVAVEIKKDGYPMTLEARAYDDGAAFRMVFNKEGTLEEETTSFTVPEDIRNVFAMKFRFSYEEEFNRVPLEDLHQNLWIFPMLLECGRGVWGLITEAAVFGDYGGMILSSKKESPRCLSVTPPPDQFDKTEVPVATPWRVILAGSLDDIVNSNTIENLNPPCEVEDTSFVKPGMIAWSWMTEGRSPGDFNRQKDFIDLAAKMGWPYSLDDGGWKQNNVDIPALVAYGKEKGVGVWIWEHRKAFMDREVADKTLELWASWGIAGVKIDFFESDTKERIALYDTLAELCAKHKLMVNFHGASKPAGEIRRWPHVMTREGVMGGENYQFGSRYYVQPTARHNCTLPFTRNAVGPMDFTPTTYRSYKSGTTDTHQTALPVVFTSYVTHIGESPEPIAETPCSEFLKGLPTAWDESKLLEGNPQTYATMARRKGDNWWIGGICALRSRTATVDLSFLADGEYKATLYKDGLGDLNAVDVSIGALEPISRELFEHWEKDTGRPNCFFHNTHLCDISEFTATKETVLEIPCVLDGGFCLKLEKIN